MVVRAKTKVNAKYSTHVADSKCKFPGRKRGLRVVKLIVNASCQSFDRPQLEVQEIIGLLPFLSASFSSSDVAFWVGNMSTAIR